MTAMMAVAIFLSFVRLILACTWRSTDHHDQRDDQTVQGQYFGKDEDKNHADVETRLLSVSSHTGISHDSNGHTSAHAGQTDAEAGSQMEKAPAKTINWNSRSSSGQVRLVVGQLTLEEYIVGRFFRWW